MRMTRSFRRSGIALAGLAVAALALSACSSTPAETDSGDEAKATYKIGVSQFVQHPALDAATAGFKQAFEDAGIEVEWDDQNASGDQANAVSIAQSFAFVRPRPRACSCHAGRADRRAGDHR